MGWIIFAVWMILGVSTQLFIVYSKNADDKSKEKKKVENGIKVCMWIGISILGTIFLYGLGWLWYYFCCGFLVFEDPSPGWKIIWGITSLIPLGFILGFIAICLGHNPFKD